MTAALDLREASVSERGQRRLLGLVKELGRQPDRVRLELIADPVPELVRHAWDPANRIISPHSRTRVIHHRCLGHLRRLIWDGAQVMHFLTGDVWQVPTCRTVVSLPGLAALRIREVSFARRDEERAYRNHLETIFCVSDRVVTHSAYAQSEILQLFPQVRDKLIFIRPGVDPEFFPEEWGLEDRSRFRLNIGSKRGFFLHTGGVDVLSGLDFLLEVYQIYRERYSTPRKLLLTGDPHRPHCGLPTLYEMVARRGLLGDVILVGQVSDGFLRRLYSSAALLVHPARGGNYGFAPLEAMACGCPVLCSDAGALPELAGPGAMVLPFQSPEVWAEKMDGLAENREIRMDLIERGIEHARKFSWECAAREMIAIYQQTVQGS